MDTPWVAKEYPADDAWHIHTPDGGWIASVHIDGEPDLARKQARLIAAAPDFFEAAVAFVADVDASDLDDLDYGRGLAQSGIIEAFRAAIDKATQP